MLDLSGAMSSGVRCILVEGVGSKLVFGDEDPTGGSQVLGLWRFGVRSFPFWMALSFSFILCKPTCPTMFGFG